MEAVITHLAKYVNALVGEKDETFEYIFNCIDREDKYDHKGQLLYLFKLLQAELCRNQEGLKCLHIHIEDAIEEDVKELIAEFTVVFFFHYEYLNDSSSLINERLKQHINTLEKEINRPLQLPSRVTKIEERKIRQERKNARSQLKFCKDLKAFSSFAPKTLFNTQLKLHHLLKYFFTPRPFAIDILNDKNFESYVYLNSQSIDNIKSIKVDGKILLKQVNNIVLFDCENSTKRFGNFNYELLNNLNLNHQTNFRNLVLFTFNKRNHSIESIKSKINLVQNRFKLKPLTSYTVLSPEIASLNEKQILPSHKVAFVGEKESLIWDSFVEETNIWDLYELFSIKMLNLYSLTFNDEIKAFLLSNIFTAESKSKFLTEETKMKIQSLGIEIINNLRELLSNVLDLIIQMKWGDEVMRLIKDCNDIILPEFILNNVNLVDKIVLSLNLKSTHRLVTWSTVDCETSKPILILAYRDQGNYPFHFYPNIIETKFNNSEDVQALFIGFLFKIKYEWANYNACKSLQRLLDHPFRDEHFKWIELKKNIYDFKPQLRNSTVWDLEHDYAFSDHRDIFKIKYENDKKARSYVSSELFIVQHLNTQEFRVEKLVELANIDFDEERIRIQRLEEIQESINIYENLIKFNQHEEELNVIRSLLDLDDSAPGRLWKILLERESKAKSDYALYEEIRKFLEGRQLKIVSFHHFKSSWINPESESLTPLSKKVFLALCEFLGIPRTYYTIMQRIKNTSKQATRKSTSQMNNLLRDLFNDGCFDTINYGKEILKGRIDYYRVHHPLDEIGIDESNILINLNALVELVQPELKLKEVEIIEQSI